MRDITLLLYDTHDADSFYSDFHIDPEDAPAVVESVVATFSRDDIVEETFHYYESTVNTSGFDVGGVVSSHFECDIIVGDTGLTPEMINGAFMEIRTGSVRNRFILDPIKSIGKTAHISGYDVLSASYYNKEVEISQYVSGKTVRQAIGNLDFCYGNSDPFPNDSFLLPEIPEMSMTRRDALGYLAQICGCYVKMNDYYVRLKSFTFPTTSSTAIDIGDFTEQPDLDYYPLTVTGAYVESSDGRYYAAGDEGFYVTITGNPFIRSLANALVVANTLDTLYSGMTFYPFTASVPSWTDARAGNTYCITDGTELKPIIILTYDMILDGGSTWSCEVDRYTNNTAESIRGQGGSSVNTSFNPSWSDRGNESNPVYYDASGTPQACRFTLNEGEDNELTSVSTTSGTNKNIASVALPQGMWILTATARFAQNTSGMRAIFISDTSGGNARDSGARVQTAPSPSGQTMIQITYPIVLSAPTTLYIVVQQNSGSSLSVTGSVKWLGFSIED